MGSRDIVDIETRPWKVGFDDPVLEAGGIDRPLLRRGHGFRYDGLDIDKKELCHTIYDHFWVQSIERSVPENYQMIISMTLLEHVQDNAASAKSMFEALLPSGTTHHYVPSRWHPYALILRLVGPKLQKRLITSLRSEQEASVSGYPTFFNQCTSRAMRLTFERAG
ncbi:MAG: hypothetical protein QF462_15980, partial [Myxococcota bacterium]|nr:hypothetical protein [Myxococcota bacterium]